VATVIVIAAAGAGGALLFAIAENGDSTFPDLIKHVAYPAAAVIAALMIIAALVRWRRLWSGVLLGIWTGLVGTVVLEVIREIGFRMFHSMPGDIPKLMGVLLQSRLMQGPSAISNLAGWGDHFWNGAMFAVPYVLLLGGFPRSRPHWNGAAIGAVYGALLGTGFLLSPLPRALGAGTFGAQFGARMAVTVYVAHVGFGAAMGWLVHRFGKRLDPIWVPALWMFYRCIGRDQPARLTPSDA
jgi:hypothetical protein